MANYKRIAGNRAFTRLPPWRRNINALSHATTLIQTGAFQKPSYYDAMRKFPPRMNMESTKKARTLAVPHIEDKMIKILLRRRPILKLEWSEKTDYMHVPIRQKFVEKQLELMKTENLEADEAYWKVDTMFDQEILEFEEELVEQKGDIILKARRSMSALVEEREKFLSNKRDEFHAKKYLTPRKMRVAEHAEAALRWEIGDKPLRIYGNATKRKKAVDFSYEDLDKETRSVMDEVQAGVGKALDIYENPNPIWEDC